MRIFPWPFWVLCTFLPVALTGQSMYIGISGGGGLPNEVLIHGGVPVEIPLKEHFSLQIEAVYIQRENFDLLPKLPRGRNYIRPVISYMEFPVLGKWKLPFEIVDLYAVAGPKVGYGIHLSSTFEEDNILYAQRFSFTEEGVSRFDIGLSVGAGVEKVISRGRKLFVDFRYYLGLHNINSQPGEEIFNNGKAFALGFLIPF
jgi:hypothetical protein